MKQPQTTLPSLNALCAFETAARHMSFKHAATELHVSASAVGHLEHFRGKSNHPLPHPTTPSVPTMSGGWMGERAGAA